MIALDTNVLARFFIDDINDEEAQKQQKIAKKVLLSNEQNYVSLTVILEFVWVMKHFYGLSKEEIYQVLQQLCRLPNVLVASEKKLHNALSLFMQGMDFADALHLAQATHCEKFYTFDKKFIKKSRLNTTITAELPQ